MSPCLEPSTTDATTFKTARVESSAVIDGIPRFSSFAAISCVWPTHRIDGVALDAIDATPPSTRPQNEDAESNRQRREVDPPGNDVPPGARVQDAVHEVVAHEGPGVARDVGRDARGAKVAHDAAEGQR